MSTNNDGKTIGERLGIGTSLRQEAAARAWLDWFKAEFNMHPDRIVKDARDFAERNSKKDVVEVIEMFRELTIAEALQFVRATKANIVGSLLGGYFIVPVNGRIGRIIWDRFDFSVRKWSKKFRSRASSYGVRPVELLEEFESVFPEVIRIVFEKAARLHLDPRFGA